MVLGADRERERGRDPLPLWPPLLTAHLFVDEVSILIIQLLLNSTPAKDQAFNPGGFGGHFRFKLRALRLYILSTRVQGQPVTILIYC